MLHASSARRLPTILAAAALCVVAGLGLRRNVYSAAENDGPCVKESAVYYGTAVGCRAPAEVRADEIYESIPEYRRIVDEKLTEKSPLYWVYLQRASLRFRAAVEDAARQESRDLVAERGSVSWPGHEIPDITDEAKAAVPRVEPDRARSAGRSR